MTSDTHQRSGASHRSTITTIDYGFWERRHRYLHKGPWECWWPAASVPGDRLAIRTKYLVMVRFTFLDDARLFLFRVNALFSNLLYRFTARRACIEISGRCLVQWCHWWRWVIQIVKNWEMRYSNGSFLSLSRISKIRHSANQLRVDCEFF